MKHLFAIYLLMISVPVIGEDLSSLPAVLAWVEAKNPELISLRREAQALEGRWRAVAAWPELEVGFSKEDSPSLDPMTHFRLEQAIPFPGKRTGEARMVEHEAKVARERARQRTLELRAEARLATTQIHRGQAVIERLSEQLTAVDGLMASLRGRVSSGRGGGMAGGMGSVVDLYSLEAERGRMTNMIRMEKQEVLASRHRLNQLLNRSPDEPVEPASSISLMAPPGPVQRLQEEGARQNPQLAQAAHMRDHAEIQRGRARLAWAPDIGVMWDEQRMEGGERGREVGISLMVPLWLGPAGENREAGHHLAATQSGQLAMENEVARMIATEHAEVAARLATAQAYETTILPAARSALNLSRRQFEAGRMDFLRVLEALRSAAQSEVEYQDALLEYARHWGMLETAVGVPLESIHP